MQAHGAFSCSSHRPPTHVHSLCKRSAPCSRRSRVVVAAAPPTAVFQQRTVDAEEPQHEQQGRWQRADSQLQRTTRRRTAAAADLERSFAPPRQQPYVPRAPDAVGRAKQLTASISHQRHWSLLQNLWLDNAADMGVCQLTAMLCRLARIVGKRGVDAADRPELFKFSGGLFSAVLQTLDKLDARGAAQCLWAYAKLQSAARHSCATGDAAAGALAGVLLTSGHMGQLAPSQLSQASWAAAMLVPMGLRLPPGWWDALQERLLGVLPQDANAIEASSCAWAICHTGQRLLQPVAAALQQHVAGNAASYGARELLQLMSALGTHQQQQQQADSSAQDSSSSSSNHWLAACCSRLHQLAPLMTGHEVATALSGLARLGFRNAPSSTAGHTLPVALSTRLLKRALDMLPSSSPRALCSLAHALAVLRLNPGPWWWANYLPFATAAMHVYTPTDMAVQAWALSRLCVEPGPGWMTELLQHSGFKMQGFGAQELSMLLTALGKWRASPALWWWAAYEEACQHMLDYCTAAELAALLCGMGSTGPPPPVEHLTVDAVAAAASMPATLAALAAAQWQAAAGSRQQQLQQVVAAAQPSRIRRPYQHKRSPQQAQEMQAPEPDASDYIPSGAWTAALLVAARRALPGAPAGTLAGIIMGLARLNIHPSGAWLAAFEAAVLAALPAASLKEAAGVLWGVAVLEEQPSGALVQALDWRIQALLGHNSSARERQQQQRHALTVQALQQAAAAAAAEQSQPQPQHDWSRLFRADMPLPGGAAGPAVTPDIAAQLLWSVATLPQPEGVAPWVDDLLVAVLPSLQLASSSTLLVMLRALAWMKHRPCHARWLEAWAAAFAAASAAPAAEAAAQAASSSCCAAAERVCLQWTVVLWCIARLGGGASNCCAAALHALAPAAVDQTQPLLGAVSGPRLCLLLHQVAWLRLWPGEAWVAAAESALAQRQLPQKHAAQAQADLQMLGCGV